MLVIVLSFVVALLTIQSLSDAKLRFIYHSDKEILEFFHITCTISVQKAELVTFL